jgi:hypothetical protein
VKGLKTYLIIGSIFLVLYIFAEANRPKVINWTETLSSSDKIPFGAYITSNRLNDVFPGAKITPYRQAVYSVIADDSISNSSYVIIAPSIDFAKPDYDVLIKYLREGNDVFIASEDFGKIFGKKLGIYTKGADNATEEGIPAHFLSPWLDSAKYYTVGKRTGNVIFSDFDTARTIVLGSNKQHEANFIKVKFGKGSLYLCANPLFFTNYSLLQPEGQQYASTALSFVKNTKNVAWDEYYTQGAENEGSAMRVFLNNPALRWAYYISIFTLLAFVLYEVKRRQRIIPVVKPLENSTLSFVSTVGQVYFERRDNLNITRKKILYFLEHLRVEYNLKTNPLDNEFIENFSNKTGIGPEFAAQLVNYINFLSAQQYVSNQQLIDLNKLTEQFYTKAR